MKILILYATYSGSTDLASAVIEETLKTGHEVKRLLVSQTDPQLLNEYQLIVLCSPSWDFDGNEGMPHEDFLTFFEKVSQNMYENKKFAVLGLGDSSYAKFCGAVDHLEKFVNDKKGVILTPSLKIDGFFYDQTGNTQKIKNWVISWQKELH